MAWHKVNGEWYEVGALIKTGPFAGYRMGAPVEFHRGLGGTDAPVEFDPTGIDRIGGVL